jgi:hypothetical protein
MKKMQRKMNSLTLFGKICSDIRYRPANENDASKVTFSIESPSAYAPLRFFCFAFGKSGEHLRYLQEGQWGVACGTLASGYDNKTNVPTMAFHIKEFTVLEIPVADIPTE